MANRLLETFLDLVRIPSPSRRESKVGDAVAARLRALGCTVEEDGAATQVGGDSGNRIARLPATGPGPRLLLSAHLDTVESGERPLVPLVEGDKIRAEGTIVGADDKSGVAVLLELLARLRESRIPHGELVLAFSVCEEIELLGARALDPAVHDGCEAGIVLDHASPREIVVGAPGKVALDLTVEGTGGHGAHPERRINAAHLLARLCARLPSGRLDADSTCNLGILQAGTAVNVIPASARAGYEIRSHREDLLELHLARTLETAEAAVRESRLFLPGEAGCEIREARLDARVSRCYEAWRLAVDATPVVRLAAAIRAAGLEPKTTLAAGGSDANILNRRGLPTVVLGCGMHGAHSTHERADLAEMEQAVCVLVALLTNR